MDKVIFLDRDDTILIDSGYMYNPNDIYYCDSAIEGMKIFNSLGFQLIIVTNQSGVGRGYFTKKQYNKFNQSMLDGLKKEGVIINDQFVCFHNPKDNCACRKPKIGLLNTYLNNNKFNKNKSYMIGDQISDMEFGNNLGIRTILINSMNNFSHDNQTDIIINYFAKDLLEAGKYIQREILEY